MKVADERPPCAGRYVLFNPHLNVGELDHIRGVRLPMAIDVCDRCPLKQKEACKAALEGCKLQSGVWGGTVATSLNKK